MPSTPLFFNFNSDPALGKALLLSLGAEAGELNQRKFPDRETYLRIDTPCDGRDVVVFCNLFDPDERILPLIFLCETLRDLGARRIALITPYLCYMRQDKRFQPGECVNAIPFAKLLSAYVDFLVTMDPHLHRIHSLDEVYRIPTQVVEAAPLIAEWLKQHRPEALLIGPDSESEQWVSRVAELAGCPYVVLEKTRFGDRNVEVTVPEIERWQGMTPVLLDDIISSGHTMLAALSHLRHQGLKRPLCIGVHGIFADNAYAELSAAADVITTETLPHPSNSIAIADALAAPVNAWIHAN
ncbi:ribose-phosphate pyrophosphokinase [Motiliproteus sediminis]|uniref:ribose-phosphate pyrophosphokinase n=1 Tax=Motiliproteus sediminis TaxID=1468178 RepID=UPI001AEFAA75|nr:ribose-phosphate pyrophosphokinase [Motiliproteus sediminis]